MQFGSELPLSGDIEIDLRSSDWRAHHHDTNPDFRNVVLHVVWDGENSTGQQTLALKSILDSPLTELAMWLGSDSAKSYPVELLGQCSAPLSILSATQLIDLLQQAAQIRFQAKAAQLQARARQAGWEQALWEGLFRALGYKQNLWPMNRLGEIRTLICPDKARPAVLPLQARLLGVAGLLPDDVTRTPTGTSKYLKQLWDIWWREQDTFRDCTLPRSLWRFSSLRPANHPQRRLALAAHWLSEGRLPSRLQDWCTSSIDPTQQQSQLIRALQVSEDEYWSHHWTLRSKMFSPPQPLLGTTRVTDLAINVILPWLWVRAVEGKNESLRQEIERRYFLWPKAEDNSVLRLARQRLLGGAGPRIFKTAAAQQGLLQIVKDFCECSNALCAGCRFPELVKNWPRA